MQTVECRACGSQVSPRARLCPQCGDADPARTGMKIGVAFAVMVLLAIAVVASLPYLLF